MKSGAEIGEEGSGDWRRVERRLEKSGAEIREEWSGDWRRVEGRLEKSGGLRTSRETSLRQSTKIKNSFAIQKAIRKAIKLFSISI